MISMLRVFYNIEKAKNNHTCYCGSVVDAKWALTKYLSDMLKINMSDVSFREHLTPELLESYNTIYYRTYNSVPYTTDYYMYGLTRCEYCDNNIFKDVSDVLDKIDSSNILELFNDMVVIDYLLSKRKEAGYEV